MRPPASASSRSLYTAGSRFLAANPTISLSYFPSIVRRSIVTFWLSTHPSSRTSFRNASSKTGATSPSRPIRAALVATDWETACRRGARTDSRMMLAEAASHPTVGRAIMCPEALSPNPELDADIVGVVDEDGDAVPPLHGSPEDLQPGLFQI